MRSPVQSRLPLQKKAAFWGCLLSFLLFCFQSVRDGLEVGAAGLQRDLRRRLSAAENHHSGTVIEPTMILHVEFFAVDVTVGDCHDAGIALHTELELVLCHWYAASLAIDSLDADVHQVGAVGFPGVVLGSGAEFHGLACSLYLVTGHFLAPVIGDGEQFAVGILDAVPFDLVAQFRIVLGIQLAAEFLPVEDELHLIGIGIGDETQYFTRLTTPMVAHAVVACLYTIPHDVVLRVDDSDMHQRLFGFEEALHEVGLRLWFQ